MIDRKSINPLKSFPKAIAIIITDWMEKRGRIVKKAFTQQEIDQLQETFCFLDTEERGFIEGTDLINSLKYLGITTDEYLINKIFNEMNINIKGNVTSSDFINIMSIIKSK